MTCESVQNQLIDYIENELNDEQIAQINLHLTECAACRQCLEEFKSIRQKIKDQDTPDPDISAFQDFNKSILKQIREQTGAKPFWKYPIFAFPLAAVFTVSMILLLLQFYLISPNNNRDGLYYQLQWTNLDNALKDIQKLSPSESLGFTAKSIRWSRLGTIFCESTVLARAQQFENAKQHLLPVYTAFNDYQKNKKSESKILKQLEQKAFEPNQWRVEYRQLVNTLPAQAELYFNSGYWLATLKFAVANNDRLIFQSVSLKSILNRLRNSPTAQSGSPNLVKNIDRILLIINNQKYQNGNELRMLIQQTLDLI